MTEGGYFEQKRLSPTGMAVVGLLHVAVIGALVTAKMEMPPREDFTPIKLKPITLPPDPPPVPQPKPHVPVQQPTVIDQVPPIVPLPTQPDHIEVAKVETPPISWVPPGKDTILTPPNPPPPPIPVRETVRTQPQLDPRSELQPPYPASAQREGAEGSVEIRLVIGADGRVKAAEKVRATRDDFYTATERQALRYWRFKPATVDGRPVESSRTMTVRFRLDDLG